MEVDLDKRAITNNKIVKINYNFKSSVPTF